MPIILMVRKTGKGVLGFDIGLRFNINKIILKQLLHIFDL